MGHILKLIQDVCLDDIQVKVEYGSYLLKVSHGVKSKETFINTFRALFFAKTLWNSTRMFVSMISGSSLNMYDVGLKSSSQGPFKAKPY